MKLISFVRLGRAGFGALVGSDVVDLTGFSGLSDLKEALSKNTLAEIATYVARVKPDFSRADISLLPVIPNPGKILCIGLNYHAHKAETGRPDVNYPTVFTRYADSQIGHLQPMIKPALSERLDYEGEMAVVIGKGGRNISEAEALAHVAGYACYNDGTARDWQRHTFQFTPGKTFPGTGAFGPYLMTTDEVGDYTKLPIQTRLNGQIMQEATLADLLFSVERLIAYCSAFTPLSAGDVILSGTPGGVGDKKSPPIYMQNGDVVEVEIGKLGTLRNTVIAEESL